MPSEPSELIVKISCNVAYENYKVTYVTITEKLSVTTDKGQKHGHFWKIKKIPPDTILRPKKRPRPENA